MDPEIAEFVNDPHAGIFFTKTLHQDTYPFIDSTKSDLTGKYVFITGASRGIGREMALSFARAGAAGIAVGARSGLDALVEHIGTAAKEAGKPAPRVVPVPVDVTDKASVAAAAEAVAQAFPRVDVLINNAGYYERRAQIADSDPDEWWDSWTVNVKGIYLVTRAFLPLILGRRPGTEKSDLKVVINVSSIGANQIISGASAYQTAKLAVLRFTESLNADHGVGTPDGVLALSLHPGGVLTDMAKRLPESWHAALQDTPRLSADTTVFLAAKRREWLAGRYIAAPWDMEELLAQEGDIVRGNKLKVRMLV